MQFYLNHYPVGIVAEEDSSSFTTDTSITRLDKFPSNTLEDDDNNNDDEYFDAGSCNKHQHSDSKLLLHKYYNLPDCEGPISDTLSSKIEHFGKRHRQVIKKLEQEAFIEDKVTQTLDETTDSAEIIGNEPNEMDKETECNLDAKPSAVCSGYCSLAYHAESRFENELFRKSSSTKTTNERKMERILKHNSFSHDHFQHSEADKKLETCYTCTNLLH